MTTLSLAMIVKNEGATIERALNCARLFADEMIVVDTGSTDDTVAKAKAMGAKVHHFAWIDDFAAARNYAFSQCAMDWIIWLDGDDVISPENQNRILGLKRSVLNDDLQAIYLRTSTRRSSNGGSESSGGICLLKINCSGRTRCTSSSMASTGRM